MIRHNGKDFYPIKGYEGTYSVSMDGEVWSERSNKLLRPNKDKSGYLYFVFSIDKKRKTIKAHRIVAETFIDNPENKNTVDHINAIRTDNRVCNLRWATNKEQANHPHNIEAHLNSVCPDIFRYYGRLHNYNRKKAKAYKDGVLVGEYPSLKEAARILGINYTKASECANGKRKHCGGYTLRYE